MFAMRAWLPEMGNRPWIEAEDKIVSRYIGVRSAKTIVRLLGKAGYKRSLTAVICRARDGLGLSFHAAEERPELISLSLAAQEAGCTRDLLIAYCKKNGHRLVGKGKCRFISMNILPALKSHFVVKPNQLTMREVGERLNYGRSQVHNLVKRKILPATRRGRMWFVDQADLEKIAAILRARPAKKTRKGRPKKQWKIWWVAEVAKLPEVCITTRQASTVIGYSLTRLAGHIRKGWLRSYKVGRFHMLSLQDLRERFPNKIFFEPARV